jgi:hypothetical protein
MSDEWEEANEIENSLNESLQILVGGKLSSVTFVLDYWQIDFDGNGFSVMSAITVRGDGWTCRSGDAGFRDRLCEQIAKIVIHADFEDDVGVSIIFKDQSSLQLSTEPDDYNCPEALLFRRTDDDRWWAV